MEKLNKEKYELDEMKALKLDEIERLKQQIRDERELKAKNKDLHKLLAIVGSQEKLADLLGMNKQTIYNWNYGKISKKGALLITQLNLLAPGELKLKIANGEKPRLNFDNDVVWVDTKPIDSDDTRHKQYTQLFWDSTQRITKLQTEYDGKFAQIFRRLMNAEKDVIKALDGLAMSINRICDVLDLLSPGMGDYLNKLLMEGIKELEAESGEKPQEGIKE